MSPEAQLLKQQQEATTIFSMPLYQKETQKALENFPITGVPFSLQLAHAIAAVKWAAAEANKRHHSLDPAIAKAIQEACKEIIENKHNEQFVVDQIQGGAGTSIHMNLNEVIASRANMIAGRTDIHAIDHVNMGQSTNDVVPTAMKITTLQLLRSLTETYDTFGEVLEEKANAFKDILKVGRTHLQDAVPITLGQQFAAHASAARNDLDRLQHLWEELYSINLGGTAVGTGLNSSRAYVDDVALILSQLTGYPLRPADNLIAATQYPDSFLTVSSTLTVIAANLTKFANDLRLLASGPRSGLAEIQFEPRQKGSSIMPGKVNPVMAETLNQVCFQMVGNNQTIFMATQAGQFELNVFLPIVAKNLFESLTILNNGLKAFTEYGLKTLQANTRVCKKHFDESYAAATTLSPHIGYDKTTEVVRDVMETGKTLKDVVVARGIMTAQEYDILIADPSLTELS